MKNVVLNPKIVYKLDPMIGPTIRPVPIAVCIYPIYFSFSSGYQIDTIAYDVVCIEQEEHPWVNLKKNMNVVKTATFGAKLVTPNPIMDIPMLNNPIMSMFLRPMTDISFPTIGDPIMIAIEYMEKMYPIIEMSKPHFFSSRGKNGTTREYQLFESMLTATRHTTSQFIILSNN